MKRGVKKGTVQKNSWNAVLLTMLVGDRLYKETTLQGYGVMMRNMVRPKHRRPEIMQSWEFSTTLLTAVAASKAGDIRFLVCVERTK